MQKQHSLKKKTILGLFWSFSDLIANQGIRFIIQIILARLLLPNDFGIIGMISVFIAISQSIIDSGFSNALIREKKSTQEDYSTVFYFNLFISIILYVVLFFSANAISKFFNEPRLVSILRILALVLIINSFGLIQRTILIKKIDFKIQTKISIISSIISGIIAILLAYLGFGIWSLVFQTLIMQFLQSLLLSLTNRWTPSLVFSINSFKRLFGFGWKLLVSGLINTLYNNLYYLIIGKVFSAIDLGYYTNAQRLRDTASQSISTSVQKVGYPILSSIKDDEDRLREGYKKIIRTSVYITFPFMIGLATVANPLIRLIFGSNWINSIEYFQVLCLSGMLYPLHAINLDILQVKGRSDLFLGLEIIKKLIGVLSIVIVLYFKLGIMGLVWALVITSFISYFLNSYYSAELLNYSTLQQIKDIAPSFISSIFMGLIVYFSGLILPNNNLVKLLLQVFIGTIVYIGISKIARINEFNIIYELICVAFKRGKLKKSM